MAGARRDRPLLSGLMVGLAIADKSWGALAAGPVLVALDRDRGRALAAMALSAGALTVPFMIARTGGVAGQAAGFGVGQGEIFNPWQLWWFLGAPAAHAGEAQRVGPVWLGGFAHLLIVAIMPPISLGFALRHRRSARRRGPEVLLLLALLLALRCALDPWNISYYALPFLWSLLAWETERHRRPPLITLGATFVAWLVLVETTALVGSQNTLALLYIVAVIPAIVVLAHGAFSQARGNAHRRPAAATNAAADLQPA